MKLPLILLVEDDPNDQELIKLCLSESKIPHELVVLQNGEEALNYLPSEKTPSLILLDLKTPKVGGIEVLKKLKGDDFTRHIPVVIFTSSKEEKDIHESYLNGANGFVHKPIEFNELHQTVSSIATFWLQFNSPLIISSEA
jgi:two-component system response regulator